MVLDTAKPLDAAHPFPVVVTFEGIAEASVAWARAHREEVNGTLASSGGLLFRGTGLTEAAHFEAFSSALTEHPWTGNPNVFTMRHQVKGSVYTSTDYPETQSITQHCEFSHSPFKRWPMKLFFYCQVAAQEGGETPIADSRRVFQRIPSEMRELFLKKGLSYHRIFYDKEVSWKQVFQTDDPAHVENFCRMADAKFEWRNDGRDLRLEWRLHVAAKHPFTHEHVWFNQAHTVAFAAISEEMRACFVAKYGFENRPMDCSFGDGTPIPPQILKQLQTIYDEESVAFPWRVGDVLLIDNMLMSHGRRPFRGPRTVLVSMGNEATVNNVQTF
jgi:alpha-ketoglutarate-dependent taurine dioxygenase